MNSLIINRHNYEEHFLLYVDNELKAADRKAVENFVKQNEDLGRELEILKHSKLTDDAIVFNEKDILYKKENGISLANYEEYFLLLADNELNEKERDDIEKFVLKHPELQQEFTLLQQTKLEPELIAFTGKEELYRLEKKERRIIPLVWMRMSVAAAILGFVAAGWLINNRSVENNNKVVAVKETVKKPVDVMEKPGQQAIKESPSSANVVKTRNINQAKDLSNVSKTEAKRKIENFSDIKKIENANMQKQAQNNQLVKQENVLPVENKISQEQKSLLNVEIEIKNKESIKTNEDKSTDDPIFANHPVVEEQPVLVKNALYREIDNSDEEEKSIYIGGSQINKNKLKGLFKKAVRLFDKKGTRKDSEQTM